MISTKNSENTVCYKTTKYSARNFVTADDWNAASSNAKMASQVPTSVCVYCAS